MAVERMKVTPPAPGEHVEKCEPGTLSRNDVRWLISVATLRANNVRNKLGQMEASASVDADKLHELKLELQRADKVVGLLRTAE